MQANPRANREPASLADLIADCRDLSPGALPPPRPLIDLTKRVPTPRRPTPGGRRRQVIVIRDSVVSLVDGYGDYGSG
jgi:hypothetical protein